MYLFRQFRAWECDRLRTEMWKLLSKCLLGLMWASRDPWGPQTAQPNPKLQCRASVSGYPAQHFGGSSPRASHTLCVVTAQILYIISGPSADLLLSLCFTSSAPIPWWEFSAAFCPWSNPMRLKKRHSISLQSWVIFTRCNYSLTPLHSPWNFALKLSDTASY